MNPFFLGAVVTATSGLFAYAAVYRLLRPAQPITTRSKRGSQFAAILVSLIVFATLGDALARWNDENRWIAVPLLSLLAWPLGYLAGWLLGPKKSALIARVTSHPQALRDLEPSDSNWAEAAAEFASANRSAGLWAKSFAAMNGDEAKAKAAYLRERATELALLAAAANRSSKSRSQRNERGLATIGDAQPFHRAAPPTGRGAENDNPA